MPKPGNRPRLRDELADKRLIDFTHEELVEAGFEGDDVPESIAAVIRAIREMPDLLGFLTGENVTIPGLQVAAKLSTPAPMSPTSPTTIDSGDWSQVAVTSDSALTPVGDELVSEFERRNYYVGLCPNDDDVPELYYRTSLQKAPFPAPTPGTKFFKVANKAANGAFHEILTRTLWNNTVAPNIIKEVLEPSGIKYASLKTVRFSSCDEEGKSTLGPLVIWIGTQAGTTSPERARQASPAILSILTSHGVTDAEVEWYGSCVDKL
ncbi:unnamed protein product [Peniophora sp. CBMAI 1063]|nr:unnamed protein product [Peniophora sp. CBMAI 1063]